MKFTTWYNKSFKSHENLNFNYSPILHGCISIRKGRTNLKNFWILLDSGWSSEIVMGKIIKILLLK